MGVLPEHKTASILNVKTYRLGAIGNKYAFSFSIHGWYYRENFAFINTVINMVYIDLDLTFTMIHPPDL